MTDLTSEKAFGSVENLYCFLNFSFIIIKIQEGNVNLGVRQVT